MRNHQREPIAIAGAGRLGQALGRLLRRAGEPVAAIASRRPEHAEMGAKFVGGGAKGASYSQLPSMAARILVTVSDDAITDVARLFARTGMKRGVVLHTCGSKGPDVLSPLADRGVSLGVLHPLQTIPSPEQGVTVLPGVSFGVTAEGAAFEWAERIVKLLGGRLLVVEAGSRPLYHAAGVMASNYMVALLDASVALMEAAGIEARDALPALEPLAEAARRHAFELGPAEALTGPILREDLRTVEAHLQAVDRAPETVSGLYRAAGLRTLDIARRRGLDEAVAGQIERMLRDNGKRNA